MDGTTYKMNVSIPSVPGEHTLYMVANHPMTEGTIGSLQNLEDQICESTEALVAPLVMSTGR
ncbi:hypothetical protein [uncultured Sanguibacteroides sp.]|uniref:hypothetical protein n=1 Tax=uncultured Sanguibacteroides sp. TaxID=1635151 RepID=UPI0025CC0C1A|nr:hypothetical protein [uncultured Sanguibacteroides sp.]